MKLYRGQLRCHFNDDNYYVDNTRYEIEAILNDIGEGKLSEEQVSMASCRFECLLKNMRNNILREVDVALNSVIEDLYKDFDEHYNYLQNELWNQRSMMIEENKKLVSQASEDIALLVKGKKDFSEETITRALSNMFDEESKDNASI